MTETDTTICGDCLEVMRAMADGSVNCCVTSPPYWGLREYGHWFMQIVWGSMDDFCPPRKHRDRWMFRLKWRAAERGGVFSPNKKTWIGAHGLEPTPELYIQHAVEVFAEVKRVLRDDGTLWLNMGDSYAGNTPGSRDPERWPKQSRNDHKPKKKPVRAELKHKDLCGIPWRLAFALQADGWYLRQDIIWHKPNPMPESVRDRCTKAHEYIFLMTKKPRYYYDAEAIRVPLSEASVQRLSQDIDGQAGSMRVPGKTNGPMKAVCRGSFHDHTDDSQIGQRIKDKKNHPNGANKRSVWTVPTAPYSEAHFATFPPKLIEPCILAGCPQWVCKKCGEPRRRITDKEFTQTGRERDNITGQDNMEGREGIPRGNTASITTGWTDCGCNAGFDGGVVLDPFMGSGTVAVVAYQNNRHYIGIELNPEYCKLGRIEKERAKYALLERRDE